MKRWSLIIAALVALTLPAGAQLELGDELWENRHEGARGASAKPGPVNKAIAAYSEALDENPASYEARWKLMRALRFDASYTGKSFEDKKRIFDRAKAVGAAGIAVLERELRTKGVRYFDQDPIEKVAAAARKVPHAGKLIYWDAVSWGEWAILYGKLAAVRKGAAGRILREATIVMEVDPAIEGGGGARVLGRLHDQTPRIPFVTGWASNRDGVKYLRMSLERDPDNKLTKVFLAEALVADDGGSKNEAIELLREVMRDPIDEEFLVEDAAAREDARAILREWGAL